MSRSQSASTRPGPIDTALEPMFYRHRAGLRQLWNEFRNRGSYRRSEMQPPRPQTLSRLPSVPAARQTEKASLAASQVARLCRVRLWLFGKGGYRREGAVAPTGEVLSRIVRLWRSQHVEG